MDSSFLLMTQFEPFSWADGTTERTDATSDRQTDEDEDEEDRLEAKASPHPPSFSLDLARFIFLRPPFRSPALGC